MICMETNIKDYQSAVVGVLARDYFPEENGYVFRTDTVRKNNGVILHSINIMEKDSNIAPTFYVDEYLDKGYEPEAAAHIIYQMYQRHKEEKSDIASNNFQKLYDFNSIKDTICFRLINRQRNQDMKETHPFIEINDDLMLVFYLQVDKDATCLIRNEMCNIWGLNKPAEQLYEYARENTERLHPICFHSMFDIMKTMMPEELCEDLNENDHEPPMYVLTNTDKVNGASVLFYRDGTVLDECMKEMNKKYPEIKAVYILPSSVHETIIIPSLSDERANNIDENALASMVREVNRSNVSASEFLSDNVFYYQTGEPIKQLTHSEIQIVR